MANNIQTTELHIRATDYSRQTIDKVVVNLKDLVKSQDAQVESAKKGTTTVTQLEASYNKMAGAITALLAQKSLADRFQLQTNSLGELQSALDRARAAQKAYSDTLPVGVSRTADQSKTLKTLTSDVTKAAREYQRMENQLQTTQSRLSTYGITTANLAASQQKLAESLALGNTALARQEAVINGADAAAAKRKAAADAIAQRELQVRVDNQFAQAERDVAAALAATTAAQAASNAASLAAQHERQYQADIIFTNAERVAAEAIAAKTAALLAQQVALRAAADAAERLARSSSATARGTQPVVQTSLANQIRDIQNPGEAAMRTVAGIDAALAALQSRVTAIRGPVQDYRGAVQEATRAQAALLAVAGQVDAYNRQIAALRAAGTAYGAARAAVAALVAEMRSGAAGDDITTRLGRAQATLAAAAAALGNVRTATRAAGDALRTAGVDTSNMSASEARLVQQSNAATQALNALNEAFRRSGAAADQAGSRIFNWFGGGNRTTLSYTQRLRGEMLGLAASFVGLNAVINVAKGALESYAANQAITSRLLIVNGGNAVKAAEDFDYLATVADKIGFNFQKVAPAFTKFAIAAKSANFTTQDTRFVFENVAASSVKARLSVDELGGVLKAFEQILSKGTVQAEELRGQLGDRLPGAFQIAARAANMTVEEYTKALTLGQIGAEQVIGIARELGKTYGIANQGVDGLLEAQARYENAANRFLTSTAEGGFVQAYTEFLGKMTALLNSGQGDNLARELSAGFAKVVDVMIVLADNINLVKAAVVGLIAVSFIKWLGALPALVLAVRTELVLLNTALLAGGIINGASVFAGITARLVTMGGVAAGLVPILVGVQGALGAIGKALPLIVAGVVAFGAAYLATQQIVEFFDNKTRANLKKSIDAQNKAMTDAEAAQAAASGAKNERDAERLNNEALRLKAIAVKAVKETAAAVAKAREDGLDLTNVTPAKITNGKQGTEDPGNKPADLLKKLNKTLEAEDKKSTKAMRSARLKSAKEELAERLEIIDEPFQAQREQYRKLIADDETYNEALKRINASSQKAQAAETAKFNFERQKAGESAGKKSVKLADEIALKLKEIETDIASKTAKADVTQPFEARRLARVEAIGSAYDEVRRKILQEKQYAPGQAAADDARLKKLTQQRKDLEEQNATREESVRLEKEFADQQSILKSRLDEIKTLRESGQISATDELTRTNAAVAELLPGVKTAGEVALKFANDYRKLLDPVTFQQTVATIQAGLAKAGVAGTIATNNTAAAQETLNETLVQQQREIERISLMRSLGMIDSIREAQLMNENTAKYAPLVQANAEALRSFLAEQLASSAITQEAYDKAVDSVDTLLIKLSNSRQVVNGLDQTIANTIASNAVTAFDSLATAIGKVITGTESIGDGFRDAAAAAGTFFAQILRDIGLYIAKQMILKALQGFFGASSPIGSAIGGMIASGQHTGGVTGINSTFKRNVDAAAFIGAPRYHSGGLAGFAPNEVPAILKKNEEVLTESDPRHRFNGGMAAAGAGGDTSMRVVVVDERSVPEAMASAAGEKVIFAAIKNNATALRQMLK